MTFQTFSLLVYGVTAIAVGGLLLLGFASMFGSPARLPEGAAGAPSHRPITATCSRCGQSMLTTDTYSDGRTHMFLLDCFECGNRLFHDGGGLTASAPPLSFRRVA